MSVEERIEAAWEKRLNEGQMCPYKNYDASKYDFELGFHAGIEIGREMARELQKVAVEDLQPGRVYRVRATEEADGEVLVLRFIGLRKPSKKGKPEPAFFGFNQRGPSFLDMSVVEGIYGPLEIRLPSPSSVFGGGA